MTSLVCPHRPPCPGCPRLGEPGIPAAARDALAALARDAGIAPPAVVEGAAAGWRHRARLAVRGRAASPKIGIFQEGSHRVTDVPRCLVHHPLVNEVAAAVKDGIRRTGVAPYADAPHRGLLRYLQVVVERSSQRAQVVLVANAEDPRSLDPLGAAVSETLGSAAHSLWWNGNPERTNTILGSAWHRWSGPAAVCETIGGAAVFFPPGAFGQTNLDLADRLIAQVAAWVPDGARVLEYHAGCGAIGLGLAARAAHVAFNEVSPAGLDGLRMGIAALPADAAARTTVLAGPAASCASRAGDADVVIVDPPRKGCDPALLARLAEAPSPRLVVVSCNLDAFLREAAVLRAAGRLRLAALTAFALFPHTAHVETLARFDRE